jgi:hypothetical protein
VVAVLGVVGNLPRGHATGEAKALPGWAKRGDGAEEDGALG